MPCGRAIGGVIVAALLSAAAASPTPLAAPAPRAAPQQFAALGIELPSLGGADWYSVTRKRNFNAAVVEDIRDNLHADYVRTGWIPNRFRFEKFRWRREDDGMDTICSAGVRAMIIVPSPKDDDKGRADLIAGVREFFARYTTREFGCIRYAEVGNEADLRENGFGAVDAYAAYYEQVAPIVASFGVEVITTGVSGEDRPWTASLAGLLRAAAPAVPVGGFGFHPYGVPPSDMAAAALAMREAAGRLPSGALPPVYVTEIGQVRAADLYATIVNLAHATPAMTIYEYLAQPGEDPRYGLKNNPSLYEAEQRAWHDLHPGSVKSAAPAATISYRLPSTSSKNTA